MLLEIKGVVDQLDDGNGGLVALSKPGIDHPGVSPLTVLVPLGQTGDKLAAHCRLVNVVKDLKLILLRPRLGQRNQLKSI